MTTETIEAHLFASARERVKQTPIRAVLAFLIAWSLFAAGYPHAIAPWLIASAAVQGFEYLVMTPYRRPREPGGPGRLAFAGAMASVLLMSGAHAGLAVVLWLAGDPALTTTAVLILCGGLLNNVASAFASRPLFLIGAAPYVAAVFAFPTASALRGEWAHLPLLAFATVLFTVAIAAIWRRTNQTNGQLVAARAEVEDRLAQTEAAMADRAAMAAIVSHELRTPVSAILAGAHVIRAGDRPEETGRTAELIIDAGRLMTGMLNDLLDHSKIEARGMTIESRDFDLAALVAETERFWRAPAEQKGLALVADAPEALWLKGDPFRLRQILNNLISNAIKFTAAGEVALRVTTEPAAGGRRLRLTVQDQGQGIAPEAMDRLFTPFAQGSAETARTYGGTGLGLTVSRELARLMGGDLTATSEPGRGAAFTLDVVLPGGEPVEHEDDFAAARPALERRLRVLAADDHEINRRTLALVLQPLDVALTTVCDGHAALEALAAEPFDVVLMDVNMPGIDGNETTRRLRASGGINADTPVIGFSAGTEAAQVEACRAAGMTDWLAKPLEPRRLYLALERATAAAPPADREPRRVA